MTKIEKKLIAFAEKHILLIAALLVTAIAFLARRQSIWYHSQDYSYYFDSHEGAVQSAAYYLLVRLVSCVSDIPLHGIKWLAGLADFAVAAFCVLLCRQEMAAQEGGRNANDNIKLLLLYAGCLFAPVLYLRGSVWAQIDSIAFSLALGALCLYRSAAGRKAGKQDGTETAAAGQSGRLQKTALVRIVGAVLLAGAGVALYPCLSVAVIAYFCNEYQKNKIDGKTFAFALTAVTGCALFWNGICGGGVQSFFGWMTYHPYTGQIYDNVGDWLWNLLLLGGYGLALFSGLAAFCKKIPYAFAAAVQAVIAVCCGIALGW